VNKDGFPIQQWIFWLQMLERVLTQLQYCHSGATKCEVNDQAFFFAHSFAYCQYTYTVSLADSLALPEQDATLFQQFIGSLQF
jgi:hypothetical protein